MKSVLMFVTFALALGGIWEARADEDSTEPFTWRYFDVVDKDGRVAAIKPKPCKTLPLWASFVSQEPADWSGGPPADKPYFEGPIPFVIPPVDEGEPFHRHNHQPAITWLPNGDLMAIWYSTGREVGLELTVLAARLRRGKKAWDPSSEFFKAERRNMHASSIFHDGKGTIYHFNGMSPLDGEGWSRLAMLLRTSKDNGVTWTVARTISSGDEYKKRHQYIAGTSMLADGTFIQPVDATPGGEGPSTIHVSRDGGKTWAEAGGDIRGIHAGVVGLKDGRLMAFGRAQVLDGKMPMSLSDDLGKTWTYQATEFPPIFGGQRLILKRLNEGPILFVSFTSGIRGLPESSGMTFTDENGNEFTGHGMYAALSFDEGKTWPVRKLLTPGKGEYNGGAHTGTFTATPTRAEHAGYLAVTQTPDGVIHLISSRLHYRFNLAYLKGNGSAL